MNTNSDNSVLLSKWWQTPSAKAAFERVELARRERLEKMKAAAQAKREETLRACELNETQTALV